MKKFTKLQIGVSFFSSCILFLSSCTMSMNHEALESSSNRVMVEANRISQMSSASLEKNQSNQVTLRMVGDDLLHESVMEACLQSDGSYNFNQLFSHIKDDIKSADIAIINQETVLGGTEMGLSGYPTFNSPQEVGDALVETGFDVIQHANNHALDKGYAGLKTTMDFWKEKYPEITVVGVNESAKERDAIRVKEVNGIKIAFLSYTTSTNGIAIPEDKPWLVDMLIKDQVVSDITKAKSIADFVVVLPHWGVEYTTTETQYQKDITQYMVNAGADLIIGTHPHVIEPVEWIDKPDGGSALVYYSLGNFVSNQSRPARMLGGMAEITLEKKENGKAEIVSASIIPLVTHYEWNNMKNSYTVYKLSEYNDELAQKNGVLREETDDEGNRIPKIFSMSWIDQLAKETLGDWYTSPDGEIPVVEPSKKESGNTESFESAA